MNEDKLPVIGRLEKIDLLDFELFQVHAKTDTGAYSSSLHCNNIVLNEDTLEITLTDLPNGSESKTLRLKEFGQTSVKSSNGEVQKRFTIKTRIKLAGKVLNATFTLANRESMKNPILLGRKAIKGKFLVDVSKTYLHDNNNNKS